MSTFSSPEDAIPATRIHAAQLNNLDSATATAFALLPTNLNIDNGTICFASDTGAADAYLVATPQVAAGYVDGLSVVMLPSATNTGASTINVDSLGVKSIRRLDNSALTAGDIIVGIPASMRYSTVTGSFHLQIGSSTGPSTAPSSIATSLIMADGAWIGQSAGPKVTFDASNKYLEITGCKLLHLASATAAQPTLKIENTNDDEYGAKIEFHKSVSPAAAADDDEIGRIAFWGKDLSGAASEYFRITTFSSDVSNGDEAGKIIFGCLVDNGLSNLLVLNGYTGVVAKGAVTINDNGSDIDVIIKQSGGADALYVQGSSGNVGIGAEPTPSMVGLSIEDGVVTIKETTTPTADTNYGKVYTKNDNKLYFQDGAGTEHGVEYTDTRVAVNDADYNPSVLTTDHIIAFTELLAARSVIISTEDVAAGTSSHPRVFVVKDEVGKAGANNITISLEGGGTIDGAATAVIRGNYHSLSLYCTGTNCFIY